MPDGVDPCGLTATCACVTHDAVQPRLCRASHRHSGVCVMFCECAWSLMRQELLAVCKK